MLSGQGIITKTTYATIQPVCLLQISCPLSKLMQISLGNKSLNVSLAYIELAVLGQCNSPVVMVSPPHYTQDMVICNSPVLCLDFTRIFEHSNINKQVSRRLQATREIDICPLALVGRQQIAILSDVLLLLWAQAALRSIVASRAGDACTILRLLARQINHV